jgi:hypothetical protein
MLPGDTYREEKDAVLCDFPPGLANVLQRGAEIDAASGDARTTPMPTGPTWGGGRWKFAINKDGVAPGATWIIDSSEDYHDRFILAFGYYYDVTHKTWLPGESEDCAVPQPEAQGNFGQGTNPPSCGACMGYLHSTSSSLVLLHYNGTNALVLGVNAGGDLIMVNNQAATVYPCIFYLITDQFPVRT